MAEINDAYAALTRDDAAGGRGRRRRRPRAAVRGDGAASARRPAGPKPTRPVTGRVDTSGTYRPRNQAAATTAGAETPLPGQPPLRPVPWGSRAAARLDPDRAARPRPGAPLPPAAAPSLDAGDATVIKFGKFHGHTLGQIAAFEPSYIDWVAGTVTHDPDLVAAARVIQADLDRRGIVRRAHPAPERAERPAAPPDARDRRRTRDRPPIPEGDPCADER